MAKRVLLKRNQSLESSCSGGQTLRNTFSQASTAYALNEELDSNEILNYNNIVDTQHGRVNGLSRRHSSSSSTLSSDVESLLSYKERKQRCSSSSDIGSASYLDKTNSNNYMQENVYEETGANAAKEHFVEEIVVRKGIPRKSHERSNQRKGVESQFETREIILNNEKEVSDYREPELRKLIKKNITQRKTPQLQKLPPSRSNIYRSHSVKRLLSESSTSTSSRESPISVPSKLELENEPILYTESGYHPKYLTRRRKPNSSVRGSKARNRNATTPSSRQRVRNQQPTSRQEPKVDIISRRHFAQHKKIKTTEQISSTTYISQRPSEQYTKVDASLRVKNSLEFPKEYKLFTGGRFQQQVRDFKYPKILKSTTFTKSVSQPFASINAEVSPPEDNGNSLYSLNITNRSAAANPITLTDDQVHKLVSAYEFPIINMQNSHHDINRIVGATRYTMRGFSTLPQELKVVAVPQELQRSTMRRTRAAIERAISNFTITYDNATAQYQPGMTISGKVTMDVWSTVAIRYVEFVLQGKAVVRLFGKNGKFSEKPFSEPYLQKRIILISPPEGQLSMDLVPGRYQSEFSYKLPESLPCSVSQTDVSDTCVYSVSYTARANICDFLHARHIPQSERYAQVVKACRQEFNIVPSYNLSTVPAAMEPVVHWEEFKVTCSPLNATNASVLVKLDHHVFAVGDTMNLELDVHLPDPKRIKGITANLIQTVNFLPPINKRYCRTVIKAIDVQKYTDTGNSIEKVKRNLDNYRCNFGIPIPVNLIPSALSHARIIQVNYCLDIKVSFRMLGGTLNMSLPVYLTAPSEPDVSKSPLPLFSKPVMQFPFFSRGPLQDSDGFPQSKGYREKLQDKQAQISNVKDNEELLIY